MANKQFKGYDVGEVQDCIIKQAKMNPVPKRFSCRTSQTRPVVTIKDTVTGRESEVSLYAYNEVRKTLYDLF